MLQALQAFSTDHAFTVDVVDVDGDEALVARYDELVPVLCGVRDGEAAVQLCHYFLDENKVRAFLKPADG
jgi:hypothetical protein